jgi:AraC-like DNA-binding protein
MENRLEPLHEGWRSLTVEFPSYPKLVAGGREQNQRLLFVYPRGERNLTEVWTHASPAPVMVREAEAGEGTEAASLARFVLFFAPDDGDLGPVLRYYMQRVEAPALVTRRENLAATVRLVADIMAAIPPAGEAAPAREWTGVPGQAAGAAPEGQEGESIWQGPLPDITLGRGKRQIRANTELQDYRAEYACRYVLAHFQENINRDRMAEMVNLSPGYFSNLFRAEVGMSFSDYLIQVRIENAKRLLRRFDLSVEAISRQCGFNSLAHFSRTFKDRVGVSPLKYRKNPNGAA